MVLKNDRDCSISCKPHTLVCEKAHVGAQVPTAQPRARNRAAKPRDMKETFLAPLHQIPYVKGICVKFRPE